MGRLKTSLLLFSAAILLAACGGSDSKHTSDLRPEASDSRLEADSEYSEPKGTGTIDLRVLPESFNYGGHIKAQRLLLVEEESRTIATVQIEGVRDLKELFIEIDYDPAKLSPVSAEAHSFLGEDALTLAVASQPGLVAIGHALPQQKQAEGFSGKSNVAKVVFEHKPFAGKASSTALSGDRWIPRVFADTRNQEIEVYYFSSGDYDQNGEVNITDLSPLASKFGLQAEYEKFPIDTYDSVVDGDGLINIQDITPIAQGFGVKVEEVQLFGNTFSNETNSESVEMLTGSKPFMAEDPDLNGQRKVYSFQVDREQLYGFRARVKSEDSESMHSDSMEMDPAIPLRVNFNEYSSTNVYDDELEETVALGKFAFRDRNNVEFDSANRTLIFDYWLPGDFNQDSVVDAWKDFYCIQFWLKHVERGGPFDQHSFESILDANGNNIIGIDDLTPVGSYAGQIVDGYHLFGTDSPESLPLPIPENDEEIQVPVASIEHTGIGRTITERGERLRFQFDLNELGLDHRYYWIRSYFGSEYGDRSMVIDSQTGEFLDEEQFLKNRYFEQQQP